MSKVFHGSSDCRETHSKSILTMTIHRKPARAFFTCLVLGLSAACSWAAILKRFDAPDPKQEGYLKSFRPPALSFRANTSLPADRYSLLFLPIIQTDGNVTDANATLVASITPPAKGPTPSSAGSISVRQPPVALPSDLGPPPVLPQADPFDVAALDEPSTDDLIDALEREVPRDSFGLPTYLPFVPPYSVAPANLEIRSRSSYERRPRK